MGWDSLSGTGVATAQKIVQRPTPFLELPETQEPWWHCVNKPNTFSLLYSAFAHSMQIFSKPKALSWNRHVWHIVKSVESEMAIWRLEYRSEPWDSDPDLSSTKMASRGGGGSLKTEVREGEGRWGWVLEWRWERLQERSRWPGRRLNSPLTVDCPQ